MDLHLHLSVAFRALDKKWGEPVDLNSSAESFNLPCLPAVIERPTITFSSEEFLRTRRIRATPYSRYQDSRRRGNIKTNDSFADISSSRIPLSETEATSIDSGLDQESKTVSQLVKELSTSEVSSRVNSCDSLDSIFEDRKAYASKNWKKTAKTFIEKRCKRIVRN